jgi:hypothetical protein
MVLCSLPCMLLTTAFAVCCCSLQARVYIQLQTRLGLHWVVLCSLPRIQSRAWLLRLLTLHTLQVRDNSIDRVNDLTVRYRYCTECSIHAWQLGYLLGCLFT